MARIGQDAMNICVVGAGYVGLVTATGFALKGHQVALVEKAEEKVSTIKSGSSPFFEPGLEEALKKVLANQHMVVTNQLSYGIQRSSIVFLCVDTPSQTDGSIGLTVLKEATKQVGDCLSQGEKYRVIVVKSTTVPTTTESVLLPILKRIIPSPFGLCVNPEFLREGQALENVLHPDRVVIGSSNDEDFNILAKLYADFKAPIFHTTPSGAEMIKYVSNALLATMISFSNEISNICEVTPNVDVTQVMNAIHLDKRLSPLLEGRRIEPGILSYLRAGCGYGGHCLPKDLKALIAYGREHGLTVPLLSAVDQVNNLRALQLVKIAQEELGELKDKSIAVLGLAFKDNSDDIRESPAIQVVEGLLEKGAIVKAYDALALKNAEILWKNQTNVYLCSSTREALTGTSASIIVTASPEFAEIPPRQFMSCMRTPVVIDGRRCLNAEALTAAGCRYLGIGIGSG